MRLLALVEGFLMDIYQFGLPIFGSMIVTFPTDDPIYWRGAPVLWGLKMVGI